MPDLHSNHMKKNILPTDQSEDKQNNYPQKSEIALREEEVLSFWKEQDIFNKTISKHAPKGDFVFYDGL